MMRSMLLLLKTKLRFKNKFCTLATFCVKNNIVKNPLEKDLFSKFDFVPVDGGWQKDKVVVR